MRRAAFEALFARERARFAAVFPHVARTDLEILDRACAPDRQVCAPRDLAWATWARGPRGHRAWSRVTFLARALRKPRANLVALVRHELGHVADPWPRRPGAEQRADDLAEWLTGDRIYYDERDVQTLGRGTWPRPRHLHR